MVEPPGSRADIGLALFLIAVCALVLWESRKIPPGTFEPLGSAPAPQAVAGLIILLCVVVIIRAWRRARDPAAACDDDVTPRTVDTVVVAALTLVYAVLLQSRWLGFALLTTLYLLVTIGLLTRFRLRLLAPIVTVALAMGYGCEYLFTRVFIVDLPGVF